MRYLCLIYGAGAPGNPAQPMRGAAVDPPAPTASPSRLRHVGSGTEAVTIRIRDDELMVVEGSLAQNGDTLPGFVIVEALDLNDAIRIMSSHPAVVAGMMAELRPVGSHAGAAGKNG